MLADRMPGVVMFISYQSVHLSRCNVAATIGFLTQKIILSTIHSSTTRHASR
jgi:hypothetical protein